MSKMHLFTVLLFLLAQAAFPIEKPAIEWVRIYEGISEILDVDESDNGFILGSPEALFFTDTQGNEQWVVYPDDVGWYYLKFQSVVCLKDGGYVSAGVGKITYSSSYSVFLIRVNPDGDIIWIVDYDNPESTDYAYDVTELPDKGFAVAARQGGEAWILRTDSQGDTLWTRKWGYSGSASAVDLIHHDNGLLVYIQGSTPTTPGGPHLVRYDMEGNLQWETGIPDWPGTVAPIAQAMCEASDNGLLLMDHYWPAIVHTDYMGNPDWTIWPPGVDQPYGYSLSTTMDGGILYGGEIRGEPDSKSICGVIARFDSSGNDLWYDNIYEQTCQAIYSATQLSQGGYVACGRAIVSGSYKGFLIKYAPELGIEEGEPASALRMDVSPNPCSSLLSVSFNLPEAGNASIRIFDLSGRPVSTVTDGQFQAGTNAVEWAVPSELTSGCYIVRYNSELDSCTEAVVLIR